MMAPFSLHLLVASLVTVAFVGGIALGWMFGRQDRRISQTDKILEELRAARKARMSQ